MKSSLDFSPSASYLQNFLDSLRPSLLSEQLQTSRYIGDLAVFVLYHPIRTHGVLRARCGRQVVPDPLSGSPPPLAYERVRPPRGDISWHLLSSTHYSSSDVTTARHRAKNVVRASICKCLIPWQSYFHCLLSSWWVQACTFPTIPHSSITKVARLLSPTYLFTSQYLPLRWLISSPPSYLIAVMRAQLMYPYALSVSAPGALTATFRHEATCSNSESDCDAYPHVYLTKMVGWKQYFRIRIFPPLRPPPSRDPIVVL